MMYDRPPVPPLILQPDGTFKLTADFIWHLPWRRGVFVHLPAGTVTNFASVPWWARWLYHPNDPRIGVPAMIHDWLVEEFTINRLDYEYPKPTLYYGVSDPKELGPDSIDWEDAAGIFRKAMEYYGMPRLRRQIAYLAVRGWGIFKRT